MSAYSLNPETQSFIEGGGGGGGGRGGPWPHQILVEIYCALSIATLAELVLQENLNSIFTKLDN